MNLVQQNKKIDIKKYGKYFRYVTLSSVVFMIATIISILIKLYLKVDITYVYYDLAFLGSLGSVYFFLAICWLIVKKMQDARAIIYTMFWLYHFVIVFSWGLLVLEGFSDPSDNPTSSSNMENFIPFDTIPPLSDYLFSGLYIFLFSFLWVQQAAYIATMVWVQKDHNKNKTEVQKMSEVKIKNDFVWLYVSLFTVTISVLISTLLYFLNVSVLIWINVIWVIQPFAFFAYQYWQNMKHSVSKKLTKNGKIFFTVGVIISISILLLYIISATVFDDDTNASNIIAMIIPLISFMSTFVVHAFFTRKVIKKQWQQSPISREEYTMDQLEIPKDVRYVELDVMTKIGVWITYIFSAIFGYLFFATGMLVAFTAFQLFAFISAAMLYNKDSRARKYAIIFSIIGAGVIGGIFIWIGKPTKPNTTLEVKSPNDINPVV